MARSLDDTGEFLIRIIRRGGQSANAIELILQNSRDVIIRKAINGTKIGLTQPQITGRIHKDVNKLKNTVNNTLIKQGVDAGEKEASSTARYLSVLGVKTPNIHSVTKAYVRKVFKTPMPHQLISVDDLLTGIMANLDVSLVNIARDAVIRGDPINSAAQFIARSAGGFDNPSIRRKSQALARTAIMQISNSVRKDSYDAEPQVEGALYVATLDHRTSNICKSLDGKFWPNKDQARVPPLHVGCRSTLEPVLKGENINQVKDQLSRPAVEIKSVKELEKRGLKTSGGKVRKPSKNEHSPLKGTVKSKYVTYEEWIKTQPVAYQKSILGTKAYNELKRSGSLNKALGFAE